MTRLQVSNGTIVRGSEPIQLRGTCVGGWMNMENFINGYPGSESSFRRAIGEVLGPEKAAFFFDRMLDYMLDDDDIAYMKSLGATVVRLPVNYRHFEDDMRPFEYKEAGFKRLDAMIEICRKHDLYVIIDLHAVQGWQNTDWHCDNANRCSFFWGDIHYHDRFIRLWEALAERYRDNDAVAGYNVMNEPRTNAPTGRFQHKHPSDYPLINAVYRRVVTAIRKIDPSHIIFLEGDDFSHNFEGFEPPFAENLVYSSHNYNNAGFGPGPYPGEFDGEPWDKDQQRRSFESQQGTRYCRKHNVPLWVGEFGAVYNGQASEIPDRLRAMSDQLAVFNEGGAHWTSWTYKDVGVMGWVTLDPESDYIELIRPILGKKAELYVDFWMKWLPDTETKRMATNLADRVFTISEAAYTTAAATRQYLIQATLSGFAAGVLTPVMAELFRGMSEKKIDSLLSSFAFKQCQVNEGLEAVLKERLAE